MFSNLLLRPTSFSRRLQLRPPLQSAMKDEIMPQPHPLSIEFPGYISHGQSLVIGLLRYRATAEASPGERLSSVRQGPTLAPQVLESRSKLAWSIISGDRPDQEAWPIFSSRVRLSQCKR